MGLIRGVARTAVVAGTATAVSNRVSRRQGERWATEQDAAAYQEQQAYQQAPPPPPPPPPAAPASAGTENMLELLKQLGELYDAGVLTDEEFAAQKAKIMSQG
jgi:putative oligomerization/nucleic acid binding protein